MPILFSDHYWRDWTTQDALGQYVYCGIDFAKAKANGGRGTMLKACDGLVATRFFRNAYADAVAVYGANVGAYCWLDASNVASIRGQAQFWYDQLHDLPCPISVDFEKYLDNEPIMDDLYGVLEYYKELDPLRTLLIYTNQDYWKWHGSSDSYWKQYIPWFARYGGLEPAMPAPWTDWDIWQFSALGSPAFWGIRNNKSAVDENWVKSEEALQRIFGGIIVPPQPPEEHMYKVTVTWSAGCTQRPQPYYPSSPAGGVLPLGTVVYSDSEEVLDSSGNKWILLTNGWYIATVYGGAPRVTIVPVTEPPVDGDLSMTLVFDETGETYKGTLTKQAQ